MLGMYVTGQIYDVIYFGIFWYILGPVQFIPFE